MTEWKKELRMELYLGALYFALGALGGWGVTHGLQELDLEAAKAAQQQEQRELYEAKVESLEAAMISVTKFLNQVPHPPTSY